MNNNVFVPEESLPPSGTEEESLLLGALLDEHAERAAERVLAALDGPLTPDSLPQYLAHESCLRLPTRIVFSDAGLEPNQFGEPFLPEDRSACELHIHPRFENRPDLVPLFVAYLSPLINYGPIVSSELCEWYGARITGMDQDAYYEALCRAIDGEAAPG